MRSGFCCPVCRAAMEQEAGGLRCENGHVFDRAREGYVNLLPANQKHSKDPGDDRQMVQARSLFLDRGCYAPLRERLCALAFEAAGESPLLLDAGCGEGYYTSALAAQRKVLGVDLSKAAVKKAAKRCRGTGAEIAVASCYRLPVADASVDVLVDCFSPLAIGEFRRVLKQGGTFLYVVPGPRHLWELKQVLYDRPYENELRTEQYPGFVLQEEIPVETGFTLDTPELIRALYHMTPYTWKTPKDGAARLESLESLTVQAQFRICRYLATDEGADIKEAL